MRTTKIRPVAPAAGYIGSTRSLGAPLVSLVALIETIEHNGFAEPSVGMGVILLRRRSAPKVEVINDVSGDVATFLRVIQRHYANFIDTLRFVWRAGTSWSG